MHRQLGFAIHGKEPPVALNPGSLPWLIKSFEEKRCDIVGLCPRRELFKVALLIFLVARAWNEFVANRIAGPACFADYNRLSRMGLAHAIEVLDC